MKSAPRRTTWNIFGTPEIAEIFSSNEPDTCSILDVDKGKILCIDVPEDYTTERKYIFTVLKLLLYRHALRRLFAADLAAVRLNQLVYVGDEFQTAITASYDGTSDFNVVDPNRGDDGPYPAPPLRATGSIAERLLLLAAKAAGQTAA